MRYTLIIAGKLNNIPTIAWSTPESFEWCFDGEPTNGIVAVSSVGIMNSRRKKELFMAGYNEMLSRLSPETILFYGMIPDECRGNIVKIKSFGEELTESILKLPGMSERGRLIQYGKDRYGASVSCMTSAAWEL